MIDSPLLGLVLLGAIVAAPLLLRRVRAAAPDGLRVMGRTALHEGAVVAVVAVGDRRLLLGAGEKGVQLLAELDDAGDEALSPVAPITAGRTDAARHPTSTDPVTDAALQALLDGSATTTAGPGTGLTDRLRAMTVRTAPTSPLRRGGVGGGRPLRVPLRR
jgi:flagellar biogenesis protein FliO